MCEAILHNRQNFQSSESGKHVPDGGGGEFFVRYLYGFRIPLPTKSVDHPNFQF